MLNTKSNKETLKELINKIQEIKRISQGRISKLSGYETENYLSEAKSNNNVSDNIIAAVTALYNKALKDPSILSMEEAFDEQYNMNEPDAQYRKDVEKEYLKKRVEDLEKIVSLQDDLLKNKKNITERRDVKNAG